MSINKINLKEVRLDNNAHHSPLEHHKSAVYRLSGTQKVSLLILLLILTVSAVINLKLTLIGLITTLTILYFLDLIFNMYVIVNSFIKNPEIKITEKDLQSLDRAELPRYTILCPLYKESNIIPQFVNAISNLDYPKDKLQTIFLLEEDDRETISKIENLSLPDYYEMVIVPHSNPKTKPKACNYGLKIAKGEYIVIYDAEDIPDMDQLIKTVLSFKKSHPKVACIQAKLNFYNPRQNILTRAFTAEYSLWFDLVLTGLQSINAPIPLGGTSNHFKVEILRKLKGWDSYNVTEDCDLGMRIAKNGYRTAIVDSTTHEEANSSVANWFWQRSRWVKGYIQTYFVHTRKPSEFLKIKKTHLLTFQLIVGGKVLSMIINPIMWIITISYFVFRTQIGSAIEDYFPAPIFYMAITSAVLGNFLYMYYYLLGCLKRGQYDLIKYMIFIPFYWLFMSAATIIAVLKFIHAPHHWSKTKHGLHLSKAVNLNFSSMSGVNRTKNQITKAYV